LLESASLIAEGPGIIEQNDALGLQITPESVASQWDGRRLTPELLSDTITGLLWLEDRYRREAEGIDVDYPDVIVIDDEDDDVVVGAAEP
jgi:hypothetical protein